MGGCEAVEEFPPTHSQLVGFSEGLSLKVTVPAFRGFRTIEQAANHLPRPSVHALAERRKQKSLQQHQDGEKRRRCCRTDGRELIVPGLEPWPFREHKERFSLFSPIKIDRAKPDREIPIQNFVRIREWIFQIQSGQSVKVKRDHGSF